MGSLRREHTDTHLVLIRRPQSLDNLLGLRLGQTALLGDDMHQGRVDLPSHVGCVAADVEARSLALQEVVHLLGALPQQVLDVYLLRPFARKGGDEGELRAKGLGKFLFMA